MVVICLIYIILFFKSSGFNLTSSGETSNCPVRIGILLSISSFASAKGVELLRESRAVEFI